MLQESNEALEFELSQWVKGNAQTFAVDMQHGFAVYPQNNGQANLLASRIRNVSNDLTLSSSTDLVLKAKPKWCWFHITLDGSDTHANRIVAALEAMPDDLGFTRASQIWRKANQSVYTQQPYFEALSNWDFFEIKLFPTRVDPESVKDASTNDQPSWVDWGKLTRLEAAGGKYCLRIFVHTHFLVTICPQMIEEQLLTGGTPRPLRARKNPFLITHFPKILNALEQDQAGYRKEPNVAFLLQNIMSGLLDEYDGLTHDLEKSVNTEISTPLMPREFLSTLQRFEVALAHLTKMEYAYEKLFDHLKDPERGAFQPKGPQDKQESEDRGISIWLQQRTARAIRFLDELEKRVSSSRDLYFNLEARKTNDLLLKLTYVTIASSFIVLITGLFSLNIYPYIKLQDKEMNTIFWWISVVLTILVILFAGYTMYRLWKKNTS
jgi:hypothetical protein